MDFHSPSLHDALPICGEVVDGDVEPHRELVVVSHRPPVGMLKTGESPAMLRLPAFPEWRIRAARIRHSGKAGSRSMASRSEEHTSELQSLRHLVCRLL